MCVTAILAAVAVVAAAAGTAVSIQSANNNKAAAEYQRQVQNKQAIEARQSAEIQALQQENAKAAQYERTRSSALAAIGASGIGDHISYFQGIEPESKNAFLRDVRAVRLNLVQEKSSLADQVQVNDYSATISKANAGAQKLGAVAEFLGAAAKAGSFYQQNKVPSPKPATTGG